VGDLKSEVGERRSLGIPPNLTAAKHRDMFKREMIPLMPVCQQISLLTM